MNFFCAQVEKWVLLEAEKLYVDDLAFLQEKCECICIMGYASVIWKLTQFVSANYEQYLNPFHLLEDNHDS